MNGYKKLVSTFLFTILAITLVISVASSVSSVFLIAKANVMQTTAFNDVTKLRLSQQLQSEKNISPELLTNHYTPKVFTSIGIPVSATLKPADIVNITNVNQTGPSSPGVQFLGQTNVRTLKPFVPPAKVLLKVMPFHPTNPVGFANAKRLAELNLTSPHIKVFSHGNPINRTSTTNSSRLQSSILISPLTSSSVGFDGLTQSQAGFDGFIANPPDVQLAAGSTYVVEMVNLGGKVFTKQGSSVSTFALPTFFKITSTSDRVTDPKIIYDVISGRWFASIADTTTNDVRIAVSATTDPTGIWNIYRLAFTNCPDQPVIGINDDKFGVSANNFASNCNGAFTGSQYYIVDKSDLVNGVASVRAIQSAQDTSIASLHPVHSLSSTLTLFMVSVNGGPSNSIALESFTGSFPNIAKSVVSLNIKQTRIPPDALQPGTTTTLGTGDARVQDAAWYQGKLWLALDDRCTPPGDNTDRSCLRLDQIDTTSNKLLEDFDKNDSGIYYFYPALSIEGGGNLDFIYGRSSTAIYPSLLASGQAVGTPLGTLDPPVSLKTGSAADTSGRYGDYFGAGVDPSNKKNVWVAGEYHSNSQWSTFISAVNTPPHATTLSLFVPLNVPWGTKATVTGKLIDNAASSRGIGGKTITFTSPNGSPLPASVLTKSDGTYSSTFTASNTITTGWQLQAHFAGDPTYLASSSTIRGYNTVKHTTSLSLFVPLNVPWGTTATVSGKLVDSSAGSVGLSSRTITFTTSNGSPLPASSVTTASDGTYRATFTASNTISNGWNIQAHFAGDSLHNAANSVVKSYNTVKHTTALSLFVPLNVPWGTTATVSGKLVDSSAGSVGLSSRTITFTTSNGSPLPASSVTTASDGTYRATFTASNTISNGWNIQAHFAGGSLHNAANSVVKSYNTVKHTTALSLSLSPTSVKPAGTYSVSGTLTDTSKSVGLASKTITFTATSPITISSTTTNSLGQYSRSGLLAPSTTGSYSIQSHYAGDSLYNAANSPIQTLTVSTTATLAAAPSTTGTTKAAPLAGAPSTGPMIITPSARGSPSLPPTLTQPAQPVAPQVQPQQQLGVPIANAGASKTVLENTVVTLDGRVSYSPNIGGKIIAYQWTQLQMGVPVVLSGANTATPTFTAPVVPADTVFGFSLRVMDNNGSISTNTAIANVLVKHNNSNMPTVGNSFSLPQKQQLPLLTPHSPIISTQSAPPNTFHYPQQHPR